jgi:hypothetical protein
LKINKLAQQILSPKDLKEKKIKRLKKEKKIFKNFLKNFIFFQIIFGTFR